MAWEYKVSTDKIGGSSLYAYVGVDWRVGSTRVTYDHMGGVTSPYGGWSNNPQATLYWREWDWGTSSWGVWHQYAQDSAHYSGPGDLPIVQTSGDFTRRSYNREVQLDCDVYATTSTGSGTGSAILFYIVPALPPAANTPTLVAPSDNSATLSWSNPSGTWQSIRVERSVDGGSYSELASISASATSYTDSTTTAGHVYRYRIRYYNENAYGAYGYSTWLVNTPPAPSAITAQAIQGSTNINVELENPATAADGIEWQISDDGGENWSASTRVAGTPTETPFVTPVTSFVAATSLGGTVRLRVRNYVDDDVDYFSDWLESGDITTICPPAAPTLISPSGVLDMADGSVTFTWRHNPLDGSSQTAAQLAYSTNGGSTWTTVTKSTEESHTITPIPWAAGTLVTWRVRTKGADANYGDWAQAVQFDVFTAPTLNITSPGATITGMPISLTATYSDMAGFTCQAATVSLTKDGRTLYTEAGTISEVGGVTYITSSLDVSEFLPTNGETYTVVVTARSSSSLQTSANATFTVDFVEPQAGELQITNDPDTGYVSLLATFDNSASEITYAGSTNEQYESSEGYVRSLTVEGKSEKWNQHGRFVKSADATVDKWGATSNSWTMAADAKSATVTNASVANANLAISAAHQGHKLYFSMDVTVTGTFSKRFVINFGGTIIDTAILVTGTANTIATIGTMGTSYNNVYIYPNGTSSSAAVTCDYLFANYNLIDLTAIFGAGNEPTTIDAFKATDVYKAKLAAGELYAYDAGSLVSIEGAGVRGRNLLPKMVAGTYSGNGVTVVVDANGVATMSGMTTASGNAVIIPFESSVVVTDGLYLHLNNSVANASAAFAFERSSGGDGISTAFAPVNRIYPIPSSDVGKAIGRVRLWLTSGVTLSGTFAPMLSTSSTAHAYEPYSLTTITTPLRSAGSVHDTLTADADSWTVERKVGYVDLGTLTWTARNGVGMQTGGLSSLIKSPSANDKLPNVVMPNATPMTWTLLVNSGTSSGGVGVSGGYVAVSTTATDPDAFKTAMSGVYLFYELATPTQDASTSYSTIELGSAFTVGTDLDSTFAMTTWDGSADAVSVSVSRVNADGTVTPLLTDGASGSGLVDRYAPLNTPYQYAVTTKASSQAVKTVYVDNIIETDYWFAYWGENVAKAKWNPDNGGIQVTRPQKTRVYYAGRRDPVSYDGHAVALNETPSWMFLGKDEVDTFVKLIEDGGRGVYKSCDGWVYHADFDLTMTPSYTAIGYYGGASLGITRIDGEKL